LSWQQIALDTVWRDSTPPGPGDDWVTGQQGGPTRTSRALAIVHIAIYDAIQSIAGEYTTYTQMPTGSQASMAAAIAVAAHDTLSSLYPSQKTSFDLALQSDLSANTDPTKAAGISRGAKAAANIIALRTGDGSQVPDPTYAEMNLATGPGQWAPDVISESPTALGGYWMNVTPFAIQTASQFRAPPPPAIGSAEYQAAFRDAMNHGGDGVITPTLRTPEQTIEGIFWGYDGAPKIGTPPRLYNLVAMQIAHDQGLSTQPVELSHLLALVNTALADAAIAAWDSKYFYNVWRPINGIRATIGSNWTALGAMEDNTTSPDFTPPFPAYVSGHATFGGALFQVLRNVFGDASFTFVSDEYNGVTVDNQGHVRPYLPRTFSGFTQAERENARSRIYLGVHWQYDADQGVAIGNQVGDFVFYNLFQPTYGGGGGGGQDGGTGDGAVAEDGGGSYDGGGGSNEGGFAGDGGAAEDGNGGG
jgi:uncharacterized membrane protein YgcG